MNNFRAKDWVRRGNEIFSLQNSHFRGVSKRDEEFFKSLRHWTPMIGELVVYEVWVSKKENHLVIARYKHSMFGYKKLSPLEAIDRIKEGRYENR